VDKQVQGIRVGPLFDTSDRFATISEWYFYSNNVLQGEEATETASP